MADSIFISPDDLLTRNTRETVEDIKRAITLMERTWNEVYSTVSVPCGERWYAFKEGQRESVSTCLCSLRNILPRLEDACEIAEHAPHDFMEADRSFTGKLSGKEYKGSNKGSIFANLFFKAEMAITGKSILYDKMEISYQSKGALYKTEQYGKCAVGIAVGVLKEVSAFSKLSSFDPRGIISAFSGADKIGTGISNIIYISNGMYDETEDNNAMKTSLSFYSTKALGNSEDGEFLGQNLYSLYKVVDLVDGAASMTESIGDAHVAITGEAGYSRVWGDTSFDYLDKEYKLALEPDYFIRKALDIDPASTLNVVYEAAKDIHSTVKDSIDVGKNFGDSFRYYYEHYIGANS